MTLKVFYYLQAYIDETMQDDEYEEREVSGDSPVEMSKQEVIHSILPHLQIDDDFLGFVDEHGTTVQLIQCVPPEGIDPDKSYWIEIPIPAEQGSLGAYFNKEETQALIHSLSSPFSKEQIPNAQFRSWNPPLY